MNILQRRWVRAAAAAVAVWGAVFVAPTGASAAVVHTVSYKNNNTGSTLADSSAVPLTRTFSTSASHTTGIGTGFAGNGTLTNDISSNRDDSFFVASGSTTLNTISAYDDIMFFDTADPFSTAFANVAVSADFTASQTSSLNIWEGFFTLLFNLAGVSSNTPTMSLLGGPISGTFSSPFVSVQLGTLVDFSTTGRLSNNLFASLIFAGQGTMTSTSEVTFPTFILPEGIGVSSATLIIPSAVPLPAALPLFLSALAGLGLMGWRRRQAGA